MNAATRRLRAAQAGVAGFALGLLLLASLSEAAYWKDIQVEYLTARALLYGIDVFTPLDRLAGRYFPVATDNFPHPSPHPPALASPRAKTTPSPREAPVTTATFPSRLNRLSRLGCMPPPSCTTHRLRPILRHVVQLGYSRVWLRLAY